MKRFILWLFGVAFGAIFFIAAMLGASWYFTGEGNFPAKGTAQFGGQALTENGWQWQLPLLGAVADKVLYSAPTLTVQTLDTITDAHPALTLPDWATGAQLTVTNKETGAVVFSGTDAAYAAFAYPVNGTYDVQLKIYRLPGALTPESLASAGASLARDPGVEQPSRPVGWYGYRFRFTLSASPTLTLSAKSVRQGGTLCVAVGGIIGAATPSADTDLGTLNFVSTESGSWRAYLGIAYNAAATVHTITVNLGDQTVEAQVTVSGRSFGTIEVAPDPAVSEAANTEFRSAIWPLYDAPAGAAQWHGAWQCPVNYQAILVDYGVLKTIGGASAGQSSSVTVAVAEGTDVTAPAGGTVVFAGSLALTGNTVVIDHGCGVRTYLYGLASISVKKGDVVNQNGTVGTSAAHLTFDVKIGSKSVSPWELFQGSGGLFWAG